MAAATAAPVNRGARRDNSGDPGPALLRARENDSTGPERADSLRTRPAAPVTLRLPSLAGINPRIVRDPGLSPDTLNTIIAIFDHGILPYVERRDDDSAGDYLARACSAFDTRWKALPHTCGFRACTADDKPVLAAILHYPDQSGVRVDAQKLDRDLVAYDRRLARRIFSDIEEITNLGMWSLGPRTLCDVGMMTWFHDDPAAFFDDILGSAKYNLKKGDKRSDFRLLFDYFKNEVVLTPGTLRRLYGRHHTLAQSITDAERDALIERAPRKLRTVLHSLREISAQAVDRKALRFDELSIDDDGDSYGMWHTPAFIIDTAAASHYQRDVTGELLDDIVREAYESGIDFAPDACVALRPTKASMANFAAVLVAFERTTTVVEDVCSVLTRYQERAK